MIVREAQVEDYLSIYRLNKDALGYDYPPEKTKTRVESIIHSQTGKLFVAFISEGGTEVIAGYIHAEEYVCAFQDTRKNVISIAVDTAYRGRGIGTALLRAVEQWAAETGAAGIRLVSGSNRTEAHAFYESRGYTSKKMQKNFFKAVPESRS